MSDCKHRVIAEIEAEYQIALEALATAQRELAVASNHENGARNLVNQLQREFDAAVKAMRTSAPRDSDWKRERGEPLEVQR